MSTFGQRLKDERERLGLTQVDFAALGGAKKHAQINYEADRTAPGVDYLQALAAHGVDIVYLMTGKNIVEPLPGGGFDVANVEGAMLELARRASNPTLAEVRDRYLAERLDAMEDPHSLSDMSAYASDFAVVPLYDVQLAAGAGYVNELEAVIGYLSFRKDWLKQIGASLPSLRIGRATGPSMEPTIHDQDPVLIDTSKRDVPLFAPARRKKGPIYSFLHNGEARLKRILRFKTGASMLVSDNPEFPPEPVELANLQIVGRALWWAHTDEE